MLAIAQALASRPRLLLLDEPSAGLAPAIVREVFERIKELCEQGMTIVLVEQLADQALVIADHVTVHRQRAHGRGRCAREVPRPARPPGGLLRRLARHPPRRAPPRPVRPRSDGPARLAVDDAETLVPDGLADLEAEVRAEDVMRRPGVTTCRRVVRGDISPPGMVRAVRRRSVNDQAIVNRGVTGLQVQRGRQRVPHRELRIVLGYLCPGYQTHLAQGPGLL